MELAQNYGCVLARRSRPSRPPLFRLGLRRKGPVPIAGTVGRAFAGYGKDQCRGISAAYGDRAPPALDGPTISRTSPDRLVFQRRRRWASWVGGPYGAIDPLVCRIARRMRGCLQRYRGRVAALHTAPPSDR